MGEPFELRAYVTRVTVPSTQPCWPTTWRACSGGRQALAAGAVATGFAGTGDAVDDGLANTSGLAVGAGRGVAVGGVVAATVGVGARVEVGAGDVAVGGGNVGVGGGTGRVAVAVASWVVLLGTTGWAAGAGGAGAQPVASRSSSAVMSCT